MKILFHINHPAQYHLFKNVINSLSQEGNEIIVIARNKDVLIQLLQNDQVNFINASDKKRESNLISLFVNFVKQYKQIKQKVKEFNPDLLIGTSFLLPWISRKFDIPYINFVEDDAQVIPLYAKFSFPFSTYIVAPGVCRLNQSEKKKISYNGYHELAYLHPQYFTPNESIAKQYIDTSKKVFLFRFTAFNAHHDYGKKGINDRLAYELISILENLGDIIISSEKHLPRKLEKYRLSANPSDIHHIMAHCHLIIGDSQSMAMEAACLGVPSVRFNDYAGRISVLEELEKTYNLTESFSNEKEAELKSRVGILAKTDDVLLLYKERRNKMVQDKINVHDFIIWFLKEYPFSVKKSRQKNFLNDKFDGKERSQSIITIKKENRQKYLVLVILYLLTILILYIIPMEGDLRLHKLRLMNIRLDYIIHSILFTPTTFFIAPIFLPHSKFKKLKVITLALIIGVVFELIHAIVPYRAFTTEDMISNLIGISIGSIIFLIASRK